MKQSKITIETHIAAQNGSVDICDTESENGWYGLQFYLISGQKILYPKNGKIIQDSNNVKKWWGNLYPNLFLELTIKTSKKKKSQIVTPCLINRSGKQFKFSAYGFQILKKAPGPKIHQERSLYVYAYSENLRHEKDPHFQATFPFIRTFPANIHHFGDTPSSPIPVLFIGKTDCRNWLMHGAVTQKKHLLSWHISLPANQTNDLYFKSEYTWNGIPNETAAPGTRLDLESSIFSVFNSETDRLYSLYMEELHDIYCFTGPKSRLDEEPVYCTWNYNVFTNINEEICRKRMDIVSQLQKKGYFQIDHGYQPQLSGEPVIGSLANETLPVKKRPSFDVDVYYPDCENAWDLSRFPTGPKGLVNACKKRGLRSAIWWTPKVAANGTIQKEHPEWLLVDKDNKFIGSKNHFLDYSLPEVQDFLELCIRTITKTWGFEGIKLDFYSLMFDHPDAVFRNGGTGTTLKHKFIRMIRSHLDQKDYFLHCISCPLGNPFLAIGAFDSFRIGHDIHSGEWNYHIRSVSWLLPAILALTKKTWYANIDSCMGSVEIPRTERRSRLAFAYISAGMLEFGGPIESFTEEMKEDYRHICHRYDPGGKVTCPDTECLYGRPLPKILVRHHKKTSKTYKNFDYIKTIAFFNWEDQEKVMAINLHTLDLDWQKIEVSDFWQTQKVPIKKNILNVCLKPRSQALLDIKI